MKKEVKMATEKQLAFIRKLLEDRIVTNADVFHVECLEQQFKHIKVNLHKPIEEFTCYEASVYIDMLLNECESKRANENMKRAIEKYERLVTYAKEKRGKGIKKPYDKSENNREM